MKIMLDTNILISALVFGGKVKHVVHLMRNLDFEIYLSSYVEDEFKNTVKKKWPARYDTLCTIYEEMKSTFIFCPSTDKVLGDLRDKNDIPVLSDSIYYGVDILLTGDKDFLDSDITAPLIISPQEFLEYLINKFKEA